MSSAIQVIRDATVAALLTTPGVLAAKAVPPHELLRLQMGPNDEMTWNPEMPDKYPGCVISVVDDGIEVLKCHQELGSAFTAYKVPVFVALYATSDGTVAEAAHDLALEIGEAVQATMMILNPGNALINGNGTTWGVSATAPFVPGKIENILVDSNTHGLLMEFWAVYQIQSGVTSPT